MRYEIRRTTLVALTATGLGLSAPHPVGAEPSALQACTAVSSGQFVTFNVPGSLHDTIPESINDRGEITGVYGDSNGNTRGFLRAPDGNFTTFDVVPGAYMDNLSINQAGTITGNYEGAIRCHGFVRTPEGAVATFDPLGSTCTLPSALNSEGVITGSYGTVGGSGAFVRSPDGTFATIDVPGCLARPASINSFGTITGSCEIGRFSVGFLRLSDGTVSTFRYPGSGGTYPISINALGETTGIHVHPGGGAASGFVRSRYAAFVTFDAPGAIGGTFPASINVMGAVTGSFYEAVRFRRYHGFLRTRDGVLTAFDVTEPSIGTRPLSMNNVGAITGVYYTTIGNHGFLRCP